MDEIDNRHRKVYQQIERLGGDVPSSDKEQLSYLQHLTSQFCLQYTQALQDRTSPFHIGRKLKDCLVNYRDQLENNIGESPFEQCPDSYFQEALLNCEGNHMSFPIPPIEVLEHCLQDPKIKPFQQLIPDSLSCVDQIVDLLKDLSGKLANQEPYCRFQNLVQKFQSDIEQHLIRPAVIRTQQQIRDLISMEENYIWTDQDGFHERLSQMFKSHKTNQPDQVRHLLKAYYQGIIAHLQHQIPKCIMLFIS
jgi:Dynamin central region.